MKNFLLQKLWDDDALTNTIVNENELISFLDSLDYAADNLIQYEIYDISSLIQGPKVLFYKGWQPDNLIEVIDPHTREVIVRGYGNDH